MITLKNITIVDSKTGAPLANANVTITDQNGEYAMVNGVAVGRSTDAKGLMSVLPVAKDTSFVTFSCVGYKSLTVPAESAKRFSNGKVKLQVQENSLPEFVMSVVRPRAAGGGKSSDSSQASEQGQKGNNKIKYIIAAVVSVLFIVGLVYYFKNKSK